MVSEVAIRSEMIRLGQLLKVAGVIDSGAEVKAFLTSHAVLVNGEPEDRRGRQLHPGDVVTVGDDELQIILGVRARGGARRRDEHPGSG